MKILTKKRELTTVLVNIICVKVILIHSRNLVQTSGNASWIQLIYVTLIALAIFFITSKIYEKIGQKNILELSEIIGGKFLKIFVGLILGTYLILNILPALRLYSESVKLVLLPDSPLGFIIFLLIIGVYIGAYFGLESISRVHAIFIPIAGIILLFFFIFSVPSWKGNNLFPILGTGTYNIFVKGINQLSIFSDIIIINILMPFCKSKRDIKQSGIYAIVISFIVTLLIIIAYNLIYPYPISTEYLLPTYQITRVVKVGSFFQRWDAFFEFIWSIAFYLYTSVYIVIIAIIFEQTFSLKYYKPLIMPIIIIILTLAFFKTSVIETLRFNERLSVYLYPIPFLLPIIIGGVYLIKISRGEKHEKT